MDRIVFLTCLLLITGVFPAAAGPEDTADDIRVTRAILSAQIEHLGADHLLIADLFHHLAALHESKDEIPQALPFYENALTVYYARFGVDHPKVRDLIDHLSGLYARDAALGRRPAAATPDTVDDDIRIARHIYEKQKGGLGTTHTLLLPLLTEQARLHYRKEDYAGAGRLYRELLEIQQRILPPRHPATAESWEMVAALDHRQGNLAAAIDGYNHALAIWKEAFPHDYRRINRCLTQLGFLHHAAGEAAPAIQLARESLGAQQRMLKHVLTFSSEEQRLRHTAGYHPYALPGTVGDAVSLARSALIHKGVVLDSLIEDMRVAGASDDPEHVRLLRKRNLAKERLMQLDQTDAHAYDAGAEHRRRILREGLQKEIRQTEQQLGYSRSGRDGSQLALERIPADIQRALDEKTALIEFIRYPHYLGNQQYEDRYGAVIFTARDGLHWVRLGAADVIDAHIRRYQGLVRNPGTRDTDLRYNLQRLYTLLWLGIEKSLHWQIDRVILSPTHRINFVSFVTLLTPRGEFLNDHYSFSYVTSGRDLLRDRPERGDPTLTVFAGPRFRDDSESTTVFEDLPGTIAEARAVEKLAAFNGYAVDVYLDGNASEDKLKSITSPSILHIATHGFFAGQPHWRHAALGSSVPMLKDERSVSLSRSAGGWTAHPMRDSGLALAGADRTIRQWRQGLNEPVRNDGLVTAEEVSLLDLRATWLVVLSACDTGLGEALTGEGVFGLRRGFLQAGAQNLIMTLWSIPDSEVTPRMIQNIYGGIFQGKSPAAAVAGTQREWMHKLRKAQGLHAAVKKAGAFIVLSQGPAYGEVTNE